MSYEIIPIWKAEEMFKLAVDDSYPKVEACGHEYQPSYAIELLDPIVYRAKMLDYYDYIYRDLRIAVEEYTDELLSDCPECGLIVEDLRGDWCKDCDKQKGETNG